MSVTTVTHLNFRGDARRALEFYRSVSGGDLAVITYKDMGDVADPAEADQVVWGQVRAGGGFHVMAYDVPAARPFSRGEDPFFVSLRGDSTDEITALWEGLSDGATVIVPLAPAPWAPLYGMLRDRFGITWVLDIAAGYPTRTRSPR
jgi:PhnB protein